MDSLAREQNAQRNEQVRRQEGSVHGVDDAVLGHLGAHQVHYVVQHEEQGGNDGRGAQSALADEGSQRGSYEEQQQAGYGLGVFPEDLQSGPPEFVGVFVHLPVEVVQFGGYLVGFHAGPFIRAYLLLLVVPLKIAVVLEQFQGLAEV